ncbi:MAG: helix-turn-helix domain-containing protein [Rhodospirillales bacterium]
MENGNPERLNWRVKEFCLAFGIGRTKFYQLVKNGELRPVKVGRRTLVPSEQVKAFQYQLQNGGG